MDLSTVATQNDTAKNVFKVLSERERFRSETNLSRLRRSLLDEGKKVVADDYLGVFKSLQDLGIGTIVIGRGNKPTRFKWHYNLREVAKAAGQHKKLPPASSKVKPPKSIQEKNFVTIEKAQLEDMIVEILAKLKAIDTGVA